MELYKKNILLIMPKYFGYEEQIKKELERQGANVWLIYENQDEVNFFYRWVYVYAPRYKSTLMDNYYRRRILKIKEHIDICFIIRGASLTKYVLSWLKNRFKNIKLIMYQWDSVANNPNAILISKFCSKNYTFDPIDAKKYNWYYRPLFYFDETNLFDRKYDFTFIGSVHSQRLNLARIILDKYSSLNNFVYLYSNIFHYIKQKYIKRNQDFVISLKKNVHFSSLSLVKTNKKFADSKVIIDYTHPNQRGYTMRTIESLGHHCKLLTNNKQIVNADFYDSNNIFIYDCKNFNIPTRFLKTPYYEVKSDTYKRYSTANWIKDICN